MRFLRLLPIVLSIILLQQCASFKRSVFVNPKVSIESVKVEDFGFNGAKLLVTVAIDNPNRVGIKLSHLKYSVSVEDTKLLDGEKTERIPIAAKEISRITFPVTVQYAGLKEGVKSVFGRKLLKYDLAVETGLVTPIGDLKFDINRNDEIPIPRFPAFHVEKIDISEMGLTSATLNLKVRIDNNEDIVLDIKEFRYFLALSGEEVASGNFSMDRQLNAQKAFAFTIPVNIKLLNLRKSVATMLKSDTIDYEIDFLLKLESTYGPFEMPFHEKARMPLY